jgi:nitrogen regulatory protein PII
LKATSVLPRHRVALAGSQPEQVPRWQALSRHVPRLDAESAAGVGLADSSSTRPLEDGLLEDTMKLIKSIVRPDKVDAVKDALGKLSIAGLTVTEVRGHGKQRGHTAVYRGQEYEVSLLPKMEVEVVVADDAVDEAVKAIMLAARTGEIGDGRVFVVPVEQSYRIRTGEYEQG